MEKPIHVFSQIGKLKTVLLKRPGQDGKLTPRHHGPFVFRDNIPIYQSHKNMIILQKHCRMKASKLCIWKN